MKLDARVPAGPITEKWDRHKFNMKLVNPANKRKYTVIVVGTGLAGGSAAASLGELGYKVLSFCFQDSPRRAPAGTESAAVRCQEPGRPARVKPGALSGNNFVVPQEYNANFSSKYPTFAFTSMGPSLSFDRELRPPSCSILSSIRSP